MSQSKKRPGKQPTIQFILSQVACLNAGIPGMSLATSAAQLKFGNYFLYKKEVEEVIEKQEGSEDFDAELFIELLTEADAIKSGASPRMTDSLVRVNSRERALQVANNPANEAEVDKIVQVMTAIKDLADSIVGLINENASISVALKNKKKKEDDPEEENLENEDDEFESL
jgi:hypothetical protein